MTLFLLGLLLLLFLSIALFLYGDSGHTGTHSCAGVASVLGVFCSLVGLLFYVCMIYSWVASGYKADIINAEYNTKYTQAQIFYASDVIETIRNLNRNRHELQVK